jgi:hypothetical protein
VVGLEHYGLEPVLRLPVGDRAKQREPAPIAIDGEVAGRGADVLPFGVATLPDREAHAFQAVELTSAEVNLHAVPVPASHQQRQDGV